MNILNPGESLRNYGFWKLDALKGKPIAGHYQQVKGLIEDYGSTNYETIRSGMIKNLLDHASSSTDFYRDFKGSELCDFPVINKRVILEDSKAFESGCKKFPEFRTVVTSGSTGTPFSVKQDKRKVSRNTADTLYFGSLAGFNPGQRLYYLKIWNSINKKSIISRYTENIVPIDVTNLDDSAVEKMIIKLHKDRSRKGILAYASVYDALANYFIKNSRQLEFKNTTSVIAMSEHFDIKVKQFISDLFNCQAVSRYSNMENGIIAQQIPGGGGDFLINDASYLLETLAFDSDQPVPAGESGRIVVTDLFNYCMPLIRYDTGDVGVLKTAKLFNKNRIVLSSVEGRRMDLIFDTSGSLLSSYIITNNMWKYREIKQYQFIQHTKNEYQFIINIEQPYHKEKELLTEFIGYLGEDAILTISYTDDIPVLASGKRKKVINLTGSV